MLLACVLCVSKVEAEREREEAEKAKAVAVREREEAEAAIAVSIKERREADEATDAARREVMILMLFSLAVTFIWMLPSLEDGLVQGWVFSAQMKGSRGGTRFLTGGLSHSHGRVVAFSRAGCSSRSERGGKCPYARGKSGEA